jgi:aminobenzoyl-glutamate utilization protein B
MVNAAKVMAGVAVDALSDAALIGRAKADHKARTEDTPTYVRPMDVSRGAAAALARHSRIVILHVAGFLACRQNFSDS